MDTYNVRRNIKSQIKSCKYCSGSMHYSLTRGHTGVGVDEIRLDLVHLY